MREVPISARRAWWFPATALAIVLVLTWTPVVAAGVSAAGAQEAPANSATSSDSAPRLAAADAVEKVAAATGQGADLESALPKRTAPVPVAPTPAAARADASNSGATTRQTGRVQTAGRTAAQPAPTPAPAATQPSSKTSESSASEDSRARTILASLISQHPILAGTTVRIGSTPGGYQAVAYYKSGRIVVSASHTASLERILRHEIWHVIDWRDNGRIDWGESVPPK